MFHSRLAAGLLTLFLPRIAHTETVTISAAISLKESLTEIAKAYEAKNHDHVMFNFDSSGKLAAQIEQGAPVDAFISADIEQMDKLVTNQDASSKSLRMIVENVLVLIAPADAKDQPKSFSDLANDHGKKVAIGEPKTVPAGQYAMQTLKSMKLDQAVSSRLVMGESVRQVLTYVEHDEVYAGIVYSTDAKQAGDKVKVVATADESTHDKIVYPAAIITGTPHADAAKNFLDFLATEPAKKIFIDNGFSIPAAASAHSPPVSSTTRRAQ